MGIIGKRFVSDFSFEVSIPIPSDEQPRPVSAKSGFDRPEPPMPDLHPPLAARYKLTALAAHSRFRPVDGLR
jgi:hypothetical protein